MTAIPSLGISRLLVDVVQVAKMESLAVRIYDNTPVDEKSLVSKVVPGATVVRKPEDTIYGMWNDAAKWASTMEGSYLALLNDDIHLEPGVLTKLVEALDDNPALALVSVDWDDTPVEEPYVTRALGTFREGGIAGWAFAVKPNRWPGIDPLYRCWYGDDSLVEQLIREGWEVGRYRGLHLVHETSTTIHALPWTQEAIIEDALRWARRHS
jgi:GT2 family glycosyltransferase